jgi:hypothetical protein
MKKTFLLILFLFSILTHAQTYIKVNAVSALALIPNIGVETSIGQKATFQFDITASFWRSINGRPYEFVVVVPEYRYHFHEKNNGLYLGANAGFSAFKIQKWNYYDNGVYQKGIGVLVGATIGYQKKLNDKFVLDFFLGGGNQQAFYHSYNMGTNDQADIDTAIKYNKSGEFLLYRGGIMLSYKIN